MIKLISQKDSKSFEEEVNNVLKIGGAIKWDTFKVTALADLFNPIYTVIAELDE